MKKIFNILLGVGIALGATSCNDFLDTSSPSTVDADFVFSDPTTARAALYSMYEQWRSTANSGVFGAGLFYAADIVGSDIERHPEEYLKQSVRHVPEVFYENGTKNAEYTLGSYDKPDGTGAYSRLYSTISKANSVITAMEETSDFQNMIDAKEPTLISQMYGEAVACRATCYMELIRYYGDVPYITQAGVVAEGLASRDSIYDCELAKLVLVEPLMYRVGENADVPKSYMTRTYVQGLIGRMAMHAGGYATRRTDLGTGFYKDGDGNALTFEQIGTENNSAVYNRRSDWKKKYELAKEYLTACATNPGTVTFHTTDPRGTTGSDGRKYGNPFQYFFQQLHEQEYADESIYEYYMLQGSVSNERSYSSGRVSSAGDKAYPCKAYGQARIQPTYYYGEFDPKDKRRDVTVTVTGHKGTGYEILIPFAPGSVANGGGLCLNKYDEARMSKVNVIKQRNSGINGPYMRISEVYLNLAEVSAALDDEPTAKSYLTKIRERAFSSTTEADVNGFISRSGSMLNAVLEERKFEFGGEGFRRMDLLRNGIIFDAVAKVKKDLNDMVNGLKTNGYYTFANGNTISNYVWVKTVDANTQYGYRLTTQANPDETDPVLFPGWRGQHDDWASQGRNFSLDFVSYNTDPKSNLAIKGLFKYIDPNGSEALALVQDGYERKNWGTDILNYIDEYSTYVFYKFNEDGSKKAPIYLWPLYPNTISSSNGKITNGYGFKQE